MTWPVRKGSGETAESVLLVTEFYHPLQAVKICCIDDCKPTRHLGLNPSSTAFNRRDTGYEHSTKVMVGRHRFRETRLPITFAGRSRGVVILTRMKSVLE